MLVSRNLLGHYDFDMVHVNSPFMEAHGRASDHDPLLLQLSFKKASNDEKVLVVPAPAATGQQKVAAKPLATAPKKVEKTLPKAGEKAGFVMTMLGITSMFASFSLFGKGKEKQ